MACRCGKPTACTQKIVFTNWINDRLCSSSLRVQDLEKDLDNGLILLKLLEVLAPGKKLVGRYYASPRMQIQKTQNVALVFRFLTEVEKLQLGENSPGDVLDRNLQKTLDLLWALILHFQISGAPLNPQPWTMAPVLKRKQQSKRCMLTWVNAVLPGKNITNFTTDWSDGVNLAALVNYCKPGLIESDSYTEHPYERVSKAMQLASSELEICQVMSPDDLFVDQPDELCVMTYLSYFCRLGSPGERVLLAWIQREIPDANITNLTTNWVNGVSLGALVDGLTQHGFPQYKKMNPTSRIDNCQESMKQAQELLRIPATISAEDFSNTDLDYLTRLAYLVQFYAAKRGEPVALRADVSKVLVGPVNTGEEGGRRMVWVDLDCSKAGHAEVRATASTAAGKSLEVSVSELQQDQYRVKFACEEGVDVYTLSIRYGEEEVTGSPFCVNLAPADAGKVQHMKSDVPTEDNQMVVLGFDTKEAGHGKLTAVATGECAGAVPVDLVPKPNGGLEVVFTPPIPDIYSVDVKWGKFLALAKGQSCGAVPIDLFQGAQKDFKLAFEPPTPDIYTVDVTWGGKPVPGSPFIINLLPPAKPEKVEVGDPIYSGAGECVDFLVDTTHAGSGKLTASCKGEKVGEVSTSIVAISKRAYQVMFVPSEVDIYYLSIFFEGVPVQGSPFRINLLQKPRSVEVPQPKYSKEIGTSMVIRVKRTGGDKKAKVSAVAYGDATGPCGTQVKKNAEGNYEVTLDPKHPDIYTLDIRLNNNPIPNSPFIINYLPRIIPDHTKCRLIDINLKELLKRLLDIDSNVHFSVDTREAGQGSLVASVDAPDSRTYDVDVKPREDEPQVFDISYTPKVAGTHYLKISWNGRPIPESPLAIRVADFGKVPNFAHGKRAVVDVDVPSDVREKDIKVRIFHVITGTLSKISGRLSKGKYRVSFDPKMSGLYSIHILIKDKEIPTSPVVIRYGDPPRPDLCVVQGLPHHAWLDTDTTFTVDCSKSGSGELYVKTSQRHLLKRDKSRVSWKETSENIYTVTFYPVTTGEHTILITWAGKPIKGSPHSVTVVEKPPEVKRPTCELYMMDLLSTTPQRERMDPIPEVVNSTIGHALTFKVTVPGREAGLLTSLGRGLKGLFKDDITATAVGEKTGQTDIRVKSNYDDTYDVDFTPEQPDRYTITLRHETEDTEISKLTAVFARAPTDPTKVEVVGMSEWELPVQCFIHQEFKFEVSTKEAGPGMIRVRVEAPGTEEEPLININKESRHTYCIRYIPQTVGTHLLHLLWDGTTIPNSPLTIEVKEPPTVQPGQPGIFEISAGKWKLGDIKATGVHLDTGTEYKVKKTQKKGKYMFTLQPSEPGNYEISLRVNGIEIVRPFRFKFDRPCLPDKVVVFGLRGEGDVKETIKFKVDVSDAGNGTLKVSATGPAKPSLNISDNKDGTYSINFRATVGGSYYLTVTWAGEEIPNSPFKIDVLDAVSKRRKDEDEEDGGWSWGWDWGWRSKGSATYNTDTRSILEELGDDLDSFVSGFIGYFGRSSSSSSSGRSEGTVTTETTTQTSTHEVKKKETRGTMKASETIFKIGRMTRWEIDMTDIEGDLEVTAVGDKTGSIDVQLTQIREGVFEVTFNPTKPDRYTISILVNGEHMPNSPVVVTYELPETNAKNVKVVGLKKIPSLVTVGQKVRVIVDCRDGGLGQFLADAKVPASKEKTHTLEVESFNDDPAMFDVTYTPLVVGVHSLQLLWAKKPIPGSPVEINVCAPQLVTYDTLSPATIKIGKPVKIEYDISLAGCGELTATCTGANTGEVPVSIGKGKSKGKYEVSFQPQAEDLYVLVVMLGPYHISGSPFKINLSLIDVDKIIVTGPVRPDGPQGPVELTVDARELPRGKLVSVCKYNRTKTVSVTVKETAPNVYLLHFQPPQPAKYGWSVTYNGQNVPGFPCFIDTMPYPEKTSVVVPQHATIGQYIYYEVDVSGAGMGKLTATCSSTKSKKVPVEISEVRQGVYGISFLPFTFGTYTLYVQWSGREIPDSPFTFILSPPPRKEITKPIDFPLPLPPVEDTSAIEISCTGEEYGTIPTKLVAVSATKYHVSFKPQGPDLYTLSVMLNGRHVKGSPYLIDLRVTEEVSSDEEGEDIVVSSGGGRSKSPTPTPSQEFNNFIGSALVVRVRPRTASQRNGKVVATATGKKTGNAQISVEKFSEDYFEVTFSPTEPDTYTVSITLNGEPIPRSPFIVHYHKLPARPSKVRIIGLQDLPSFLEVNKEVSLLIDTTSGGTGVFRAEVKGPDDSKYKPTLEVKPKEGEPGMYNVMFRPLIAGAYFLSLYWADQHITNSPLVLRVVDLNIAKRFEWGKEATTSDLVIACKPTDITAYAVRENTSTKLKVKVKQVKKNQYRITFSGKDPGLYFLHVLVHNEELPISPIPIYILSAPEPKKCVIKGTVSVGYTTEEITMTIDCTEGGESTLQAKVVGPKGLEKLLDAINNKDGTYTVTYVPSTAGVYYFHISWGGSAIAKSPFRVEVKDRKVNELPVSQVSIIDRTEHAQPLPDSGKEEVALTTDNDFSFTIHLTEEQRKSITTRIKDESGKFFDFKMIRIKGDLFKFQFTPPSPGRFDLGDLRLKLPQLPRWLTYTEPRAEVTKVKVLKHTIPGLLQVNRKIFFQVDTRLAGKGTLDFKLEGPSAEEADLHVAPTPDKPYFYDVWFTPVAPGVYTLELLWGGVILPGFPLVFNVVNTEVKHGDSSSHEIAITGSARDITCYAIHVETGEKVKVKLTQVSKGRYSFSFRPKRSGIYNLHVFVGKEEIAGSPFRVTYSKPSQPGNVVVSGLERGGRVNSAVKFTIDVKKAGDGDLNVRLLGPQSDAPKLYLKEKKSGFYEAEFTPQGAGQYSVEITWSGEQVPHSPFLVNVKERTTSTTQGADYNWFLDIFNQKKEEVFQEETYQEYAIPQPTIHSEDMHIFGKGLSYGTVSFRISHSGYPDSLDVQSKGPKGLIIRVIKGASANTYEVEPRAPGKYELIILMNGEVVSGGPYFLLFQSPRTVSGFSLQGQSFQVGKSYQFTINTRDITSGVMEIYCEPYDAAEIRIAVTPGTKAYECSLTPKLVGDFKIGVRYNGFEIQGSPFLVHFRDAAASSLNFHIQAEGIETGDVTAMLESMATQQAVPISLNQLFGGECNLEFLPTEGDEYTLTITCSLKVKKEQIAGSPFSLTYLASERNASMCQIEGNGLYSAALGEWSRFVVNCEEAGPGELTAKIVGEGAEVKVVALSEYKYEVQYLITAAGRYQLIVQWGGEDILGSPFDISIQSAATTSTSMQIRVADIPGVVKAGSPIQFTMEWEGGLDEGGLMVIADTSAGGKVNGELQAIGGDNYRVTIPTSEEAGDYSINIYYRGSPLLQQPMTVAVRP